MRPANLMPMCSLPCCQIGSTEVVGAQLKKCGMCSQRSYCSKGCQVASWKGGHKHECKALQEESRQRVYANMVELDCVLFWENTTRI